jgi:HPt (histidine-containing phosphotransfer) domain-containing protein
MQALSAEDNVMLKHVTHKLNGASRCCGTPALKSAAELLERAIHNDNGNEIGNRAGALLKEIDRLLDYKLPEELRTSG